MSKQKKHPWFRLSLTCDLDICAAIMSQLTEFETGYGNIGIYDCEDPDFARQQLADGAASSGCDVRPFGAPD